MKPARIPIFLLLSLIGATRSEGRPLFASGSVGVHVGPVPYAVAVGDLDRDRIDDLVVADAAGAAVLLANPDSTFRPQMRIALDQVTRMEIARVNDDFNLDLVVLLADLPAVRVYPGRGDGTFDPPIELSLGRRGNGLVVRDLDRDGRADLAVSDGAEVWVWRSYLGGFDDPVAIPLTNSPADLVAADLDGDGLPELLTSHLGIGFSRIGNLGNTAFAAPVFIPATGALRLTVGDFDGDGRDDVVVHSTGTSSAPVRIDAYAGQAGGTLAPPVPIASGSPYIARSTTVDLDGDGRDELVLAPAQQVIVHRGTAAGLSPMAEAYRAVHSTGGVVAGHFGGDANPDLVTIQNTPLGGIPECTLSQGSYVFVWHGDGAGGFARPPLLAIDGHSRDVVATDFDHDGAVDVFVADRSNARILGFHGRADGSFDPPVASAQSAWLMIDSDLDADGRPELVIGTSGSELVGDVRVLDLAANGAASVRQVIPCSEQPSALADADFNGDGHADLAVALLQGRSVRVLFSGADGRYIEGPTLALPIMPRCLLAADLDRDGVTDLAVGGDLGFNAGALLTLVGDGHGGFAQRDSARTEGTIVALAVSSPPGEDPLLAACGSVPSCPAAPGALLLFRSVDGALARLGTTPAGEPNPLRIRFADVDGDGRDDLLIVNAFAELIVRRGEAGGAFGEPTAYVLPDGIGGFALADFDHDGRLDAFLGGTSGVHVLRNVGAETVPWPGTASRVAGGGPEAILVPLVPRAFPLVIAGDPDHDARSIIPGSVRFAGALPLRGRERLHDDVRRLRTVDDACAPLADGADGFADLGVTFASTDVIEGWRRTGPAPGRDPGEPQLVALPWTARTIEGAVLEGSACALVIGGDERPASATLTAFGPDTRSDLGVGVALDLPRPAATSEVVLFDVAGRRVAILYRGALDAGLHRFAWYSGQARPGLYFARARVDDAILGARMLVLR